MCQEVLRSELLASLQAFRDRERCQMTEARLRVTFAGGIYVIHYESRELSGWTAPLEPSVGRQPHPMSNPVTPRPPTVAHGALWTSPICAKVIDVLTRHGDWMSSQKIADAIGEDCNDLFKGRLADYADRGILESAPGKGYRLVRA